MSSSTPKKVIDVGPRGGSSSLSVLSTGKGLKFYNQKDEQIGKETQIKDMSGEFRVVDNVQFANAGTNLFMLSPELKSKLMRSDTEYGKVIDEVDYKFLRKDVSFPIDVVMPFQKFSQLEQPHDSIFQFAGFGGNESRTIFNFTYDSRDPYNVVKKDSSKKYSDSAPEITSLATSVDGYVVTGDAHGAIRLYADLSANAKLLLNQWEKFSSNEKKYPKGDPVIGIDIASNRKWIVWTTPTFAVLVNFDNLGIWDSGIKGDKPEAMRLMIHPDDIERYKIKNIELLAAKFDIGPSQDLKNSNITETWVISFTGKYKVIWNLRQCKKDYDSIPDSRSEVISYGRVKEVSGTVLDYAPEYGRPGSEESVIALGDSVRHLNFE